MSLEICISTVHVNILTYTQTHTHTHTQFSNICLGKWQNEHFKYVQPVIIMLSDKFPSLF
jgi:hypothetical protein